MADSTQIMPGMRKAAFLFGALGTALGIIRWAMGGHGLWLWVPLGMGVFAMVGSCVSTMLASRNSCVACGTRTAQVRTVPSPGYPRGESYCRGCAMELGVSIDASGRESLGGNGNGR